MAGLPETLIIKTAFEGQRAQDSGKPSPRIMLISDFPNGPLGLNAPVVGMSHSQMVSTYGGITPSYPIDWANTYYRSRYQGKGPSPIDVYRVGSGGTKSTSPLLYADNSIGWGVDDWGTGVPSTDPIGFFEADGPSALSFKVELIPVQKIATGHPAGPNITVFNVRVNAPASGYAPITYRRVVFTSPNVTGNSTVYRTVDADTLFNNPSRMPAIVRWVYEPFVTAGLNPELSVGVGRLTVAGGTDPTVTEADWTNAFNFVSAIDNHWYVIPAPPSEVVRDNYVTTLSDVKGSLTILNQMYGELESTFVTSRLSYGETDQASRIVPMWGWANHPYADGREVSVSSRYFGAWAAKINRLTFGTAYPEGNKDLGFTGIAAGDELNYASQTQFSDLHINYVKKFSTGEIGVHGHWTCDRQLNRLGDIFVRHTWNNILLRFTEAFGRMAHNRGNTPFTRNEVQQIGDAQLRPFFERGFARRAATGTFRYEEILERYPNLDVDRLDGWIYYLASIQLNRTLDGIYVYLTDAVIEELDDLFNEGSQEAN